MNDKLEAFRERLRRDPKRERSKKYKENLAITLSVAAFAWSIGTTYLKDFRTVDDVRVSVGFDWPEFDVIAPDKGRMTVKHSVIFANAGNRAMAITTGTLAIGRVGYGSSCLNCRDWGGDVDQRSERLKVPETRQLKRPNWLACAAS